MLKEFRDYRIKTRGGTSYVPILDKDPIYAARFIVKDDLKRCCMVMRGAFKDIVNGTRVHELLIDTIMDSKDNFLWFVEFYKELVKIRNVPELDIPMDKCPKNRGNAPTVFQPFGYTWNKIKGEEIRFFITPKPSNVKGKDPINNYRIQYLLQDYDATDFQDNVYPAWYLLKNTTILEQYNEKTNTRIRLDFRNGGFIYMIAGASDNWEVVPEVPREMDHFISALLFRQYT